MRKVRVALLLLLAVAFLGLDLAPAFAQETVPNPGGYLPMPANRKIEGNLWVTGTQYGGTAKTDFVRFLPAVNYCTGDNTSTPLIATRVAQFNWALARTAAGAETHNIICDINQPTRTAASAGYKLSSVNIHYWISVANVTTHTWGGIRKLVYANNTQVAINTIALSATPTLATALSASTIMASATITTPAFVNAQEESWIVEWTAVLANTGVYRIYGISLGFTRAD
jgi:hypothetical protein